MTTPSMLEVMAQAARDAGRVLRAMQLSAKPEIMKGNYDFATDADLAAQRTVIDVLHTHFPNIPVVAEEQTDPQITSRHFFTVDPLDNTAVYASGQPRGWGTIIGYVHEGEPTVGVIYLPGTDDNLLITAEKGQGCHVSGCPWRLSHSKPLAHSAIDIEIGPWLDDHCYNHVVKPLSNNAALVTSCTSVVGVELLLGHIGLWLFVRSQQKKGGGIWDFTATALAIQEAGGVACTPTGKPLAWNSVPMNGVLFAANQAIADEALALIKDW